MTDRQKDRIRQMRADGCGYRKIAQKLGISGNTVKSFERHLREVEEMHRERTGRKT